MFRLSEIQWRCKSFSQLTVEELYDVLQLRNEVFVVEQNCVYQDCDDKDKEALHLSGYMENKLVAYARMLPSGVSYPAAASIGRIVTSPAVRGKRIGRELMKATLYKAEKLFCKQTIIISAQAHLQKFYRDYGFVAEGTTYLEDGIPHIQMKKTAGTLSQ